MGGGHIGQLLGRRFGSYLGRQIALGACAEDRDDDFERRTFRPRFARGTLRWSAARGAWRA